MFRIKILFFITIFFLQNTYGQAPMKLLYENPKFKFYADRVVQGEYESIAADDRFLTSNYKSPITKDVSPRILLKFSINGKDNELPMMYSLQFTYPKGHAEASTPIHIWGKPTSDERSFDHFLPAGAKLRIRVDMSEVLKAFSDQGYYTCYNGTRIFKEDFKSICVAGSILPLNWDYDNLVNNPNAVMKDADSDGIYETDIILNIPAAQKQTAQAWSLKKDISDFPVYTSDFPLINASYNMALEEMLNAIEPDSTFRTGKEWAGVWTRDISYSIILSMAYMQPEVAKKSLMRKVSPRKRIIQDTGTGGAWPVSSDRMVWAIAAFEIYKATLDRQWLKDAYLIIKNSIQDDLQNIYDEETGLVKGESSFLDWRDQTYPKWMQPADIYESENLGTNAVHYEANMVLAAMAEILKFPDVAIKHTAIAEKIKKGINTYLWMQDKGYYAQYLYGRDRKIVSPRAEALGEALCIIFGIADEERASIMTQRTPVTPFGITCIYPQIPDMPPYHNNGIWPFVQTYWLWAGAKAGNEASVMSSIASLYRPPALFATNKENFVADDGDFLGTVINSDNMLWSLAGNISIVHRILFGIQRESDGIRFSPFVPRVLEGRHSLKNFRYLNATLDINVRGWGNVIKSLTVDGQTVSTNFLDATLQGQHSINIELTNEIKGNSGINMVENYTSLSTPYVELNGNKLSWTNNQKAREFLVIKNGQEIFKTDQNAFIIMDPGYAEYQIIAVDSNNVQSFASEPLSYLPVERVQELELEQFAKPSGSGYRGYSGTGYIEISKLENLTISIPVNIDKEGLYKMEIVYSNGNGPSNTENKCAIRTCVVDGIKVGTFVFPQRGREEWSNWGNSNQIRLSLKPGNHLISIEYRPYNDNMNGAVNQAMLDKLRLVRVE